MKAKTSKEAVAFTDIPNIGPRIAEDFRNLGLKGPADLAGNDAFALYTKLCKLSGVRQDPCVLDTFLAAVDFMNGAPPRAWWEYTAARKKDFPDI